MYTKQTIKFIKDKFESDYKIKSEIHSDNRLLLMTADLFNVQSIMFKIVSDVSKMIALHVSEVEMSMILSTIITKLRIKKVDRLIEIFEL